MHPNSRHPSQKIVPVVAIDGPSGSGKGTVSKAVAKHLGWHYLDSGAIYRVLGYLADKHGISFSDTQSLVKLAQNPDLEFRGDAVLLLGEEIGDVIRTETAGKRASMVAPIPEVRETLLSWQRSRARMPGLVADGRDMGTVVFSEAICKYFITASPKARAERRFKQLRDKGYDVNIAQLFKEISERDDRDANRSVSPLKPAEDAIIVDTTNLGIQDVVSTILAGVITCL